MNFKQLLLIAILCFSTLYGNSPKTEAIGDPTTTFVIQASFGFFNIEKNSNKGELRLFNLKYTPYFFRGEKSLSFGYVGYSDIVGLWYDKGAIFHEKDPEGILVFFESSVKEPRVAHKYNQVRLRFHSPYYNGLTDNLTFKVELLKGQTIPASRGELIDVTIFIN